METSSAHDDRRQHPRFTLKAYGLNHYCIVHRSGDQERALLVDITPAGARLRFSGDAHPPRTGEMAVVDLQMPQLTPPGLGLDSQVRWSDTAECGVQFLQELECGVTELQQVLDATSSN